MQLANNHFTLVIGIDIHFNVMPPWNPLHPFIGLVIDPFDYVPFVGATTQINGRKRGASDTSGMLVFFRHFPLFTGPFALMPIIGHESVNFFGSENTYVEDYRFSPTCYMQMTCNDIGIPLSLQPGKKMIPIPTLFAPTSFSIPIPSGAPVRVGGPYVPDWSGVLRNMVMSYGFGSLMKGMGKLAKKGLKTLNLKALKKFKCTQGLSNKLCKHGFEPVDLVAGRVWYPGTDVELPGPIPFVFERNWYSDSSFSGLLGHGTHSVLDTRLEVLEEEEGIAVLLPDGRAAGFERLLPGESFYHRPERLTLQRSEEEDIYTLFHHETRMTHVYEPSGEPGRYRLAAIRDERGFAIRLDYEQDALSTITDSAGRHLEVETDEKRRISQITHVHKRGEDVLIRYAYNQAGDLSEITDALGQTTRIYYRNHLMVKKTDRNGQSFFWEYDGPRTGARCIHTWGDGGLQEGWIDYQKDYNDVTDSLGRTTRYYFNESGQCTRETDGEGHDRFYHYTGSGELYREIDEEGRITGYCYDERGNRTAIVQPDGTELQFHYDEQDRLVMHTDGRGSTTVQVYGKENGLLESVIAPDNGVTAYRYNEQKLLREARDANGKATRLHYDNQHNLTELVLPDGSRSRWDYDAQGRCIRSVNPEGGVQNIHYDRLGRATRIQQPDGNILWLQYNAYEQVLKATDSHHDIAFEYTPLGSLIQREENNQKVRFHYNKQEELTALENEAGEEYLFERNARGEIISERGFDRLYRRYHRSPSGNVIRTERPGDHWSEYQYDEAGRCIRTEHDDGSWETYSYDGNGDLIEAVNTDSHIRLKRDKLGRVVQEEQAGHTVTGKYNRLGQRTQLKSSLGADLSLEWNETGEVSSLKAIRQDQQPWQAGYRYNSLGLELERTLPGGIRSQWQYDESGRPWEHRVNRKGSESRHRCYRWSPNDRLWRITNELTGGQTNFGHDALGNLVWAQYETGQYDYRLPDETGNLYKTKAKTDRTYSAGGRLEKTDRASYEYDEEGNMIQKKVFSAAPSAKESEQAGTWKYQWQGSGMLKKVTRPDGEEVSFEYDALGRRTAKIAGGMITRWVWDGNRPLHEWCYPEKDRPREVIDEFGETRWDHDESVPEETLITWVFDEDRFRPAAKLTKDGSYSIITDHLGTPCEAYDEQGEKVWECELDIYGKVRTLLGNQEFIPFRYQGQYEDHETGLYYNRCRYYSPMEGKYISQDPIGLNSGGPNLYVYVHDPNSWVDIFGLNAKPETAAEFEKRISKMTPEERIVAVEGKMGKVARRNDWKKNDRLSRMNRRTIYTDAAAGYHYSVDTQHGRLERLDRRGRHLGEFDIDLNQTKEADTSGRHNIRCG